MSFNQSISCFLAQQKDFILYLPDTQLVAAMSENIFRSEKTILLMQRFFPLCKYHLDKS